MKKDRHVPSQIVLVSTIRCRWKSSAGVYGNAIVDVQIQSKQGTQVAAVAGVRGVPAAAGVLGGWLAIFSRKAMISSTSYTPNYKQGEHTLATHGTFALTSIGRDPIADAVL